MGHNLQVPSLLYELVDNGKWPGIHGMTQNVKAFISDEKLKSFAPDEMGTYFYLPPFKTPRQDREGSEAFWDEFCSMEQIDIDLALVIGDFGLGSDTMLLLDYRDDLNNPAVLRLVWGNKKNNWVKVADDFETFCKMAGLI